MAENLMGMQRTSDQNQIYSNLVDMFEGFVDVSKIKKVVEQNNYNLDQSLVALLELAESDSRSSTASERQAKNTPSKNQKAFSVNKSNSAHSLRETFQPSLGKTNAVNDFKGAKQKPRIQMTYQMQPLRNPGYSDFQRSTSYYQGSPLQYQPTQQFEQSSYSRAPQGSPLQYQPTQQFERSSYSRDPQGSPLQYQPTQQFEQSSYSRAPHSSHSYSTRYARQGAPIFKSNNINPPMPCNSSVSCPSSPSRSYADLDSSKNSPKEIEMAKTYDKVYKIVNDGFKIMVLMRGCPGSGKSHASNEIIQTLYGKVENPKKYIFSADDFFITANGVYNFNPENLGQAHQTTQAKVLNALKSGITPVIIDNTNTQTWEMKIYASMAISSGYYLEVLEPLTTWKWDAKMLMRKSTHNIPLFKVRDMLERYERDITGQKLLELTSSRYPPHLNPPQLASNSTKKKFYDSLNANNKFVKIEKVEKAVNQNIASVMQSFLQNNPCKTTREVIPSVEQQIEQLPCNSVKSDVRNLVCNQDIVGNFSETLSSSKNDFSGSSDHVSKCTSQAHLIENQSIPTLKKVQKPRKLRKRKKKHSNIPDFSKDYVLVTKDQLIYQRDYSKYANNCMVSETKNIETLSTGEKITEHSSRSEVVGKSLSGKILSPEDSAMCDHRSPSSLNKPKENIVYSSSSTLTSLVAYSSSASSESEEELPQPDDTSSSNNDRSLPEVIQKIYPVTTERQDPRSSRKESQNTNHDSMIPFDETQVLSALSNDIDFLQTWEVKPNDDGIGDGDSAYCPKSQRKKSETSFSNIYDYHPPQEQTSSEGPDWNAEANIEEVLKSWGANSEVSAEKMVEKFLKSLNEPTNSVVSSGEVKNMSSHDVSTSTDYDQVLAVLRSSSPDCCILKCHSRDINAGLEPKSRVELQQRLYLDKGSMTEDCIPIVQSSNVDITDLNKVFSPEVCDSIVGLIDYCDGDINEVISSLIDSGHEILPEQFEILASIPKKCLNISSNEKLEIPLKKETKVLKVATELPKQKVKLTPTKAQLKLKEELESKIKINPSSYPKFTQQLKRQREHQQQFPSISESIKGPAPDESLVFVLDKNLVDQLQQKFGSIDLPYVKDEKWLLSEHSFSKERAI